MLAALFTARARNICHSTSCIHNKSKFLWRRPNKQPRCIITAKKIHQRRNSIVQQYTRNKSKKENTVCIPVREEIVEEAHASVRELGILEMAPAVVAVEGHPVSGDVRS